MGEIFLARLEGAAGFEKLYVIKRVLPHLADDARFRTMLVDEARIAAKMAHPNICQVYELGEDHGQLFIAMEYLEGVTLLPVLRRAARSRLALPLGLVAAILQQTCDALHYAHELSDRDGTRLNVIHRDVSPANLFVTENGIVKVLDFGIAKAKDASAHTQDGTVKGKYAYMAPEQLRSDETDRRVDVFSLGVVGFEMLALRRLFQRKTDYLTFRAVMELPIPSLGQFRPDLPPAVAETFSRALDRDPKNRFLSARAFGVAIQDAIAGHAKSWTSSEIGDYIQGNFAEELRRRGTAITAAVGSSGTGDGPSTMPVLDVPRTDDAGEDGPDDFPSIDTGVHVLERLSRYDAATPTSSRIDTGSDASGAPITELAPSPVSTLTLPQQPFRDTSSVAGRAPGRRAILWPLFAVAIVAGGALALWFMWKQIKSEQSSGAIVIVDHGGVTPEGSGVRTLGSGSAGSLGSAEGSGSANPGPGSGSDPEDHVRIKIPTTEAEIVAQIQKKLGRKLDAINVCVEQHKDSVAAKPTLVVLAVKASGRATARVEPAAVNASALGACIRGVAQSIDYGRIARDSNLNVPLKPR
jgi:serine/threonine-protein kinase